MYELRVYTLPFSYSSLFHCSLVSLVPYFRPVNTYKWTAEGWNTSHEALFVKTLYTTEAGIAFSQLQTQSQNPDADLIWPDADLISQMRDSTGQMQT